jgi:hypothetical protein
MSNELIVILLICLLRYEPDVKTKMFPKLKCVEITIWSVVAANRQGVQIDPLTGAAHCYNTLRR